MNQELILSSLPRELKKLLTQRGTLLLILSQLFRRLHCGKKCLNSWILFADSVVRVLEGSRSRIREALEILCLCTMLDRDFQPYTGILWQLTYLTHVQVTNSFPPYLVENAAVTASKASDR